MREQKPNLPLPKSALDEPAHPSSARTAAETGTVQDQSGPRGGLFVDRPKHCDSHFLKNCCWPQAVVICPGVLEPHMGRTTSKTWRGIQRHPSATPTSSVGRLSVELHLNEKHILAALSVLTSLLHTK